MKIKKYTLVRPSRDYTGDFSLPSGDSGKLTFLSDKRNVGIVVDLWKKEYKDDDEFCRVRILSPNDMQNWEFNTSTAFLEEIKIKLTLMEKIKKKIKKILSEWLERKEG